VEEKKPKSASVKVGSALEGGEEMGRLIPLGYGAAMGHIQRHRFQCRSTGPYLGHSSYLGVSPEQKRKDGEIQTCYPVRGGVINSMTK